MYLSCIEFNTLNILLVYDQLLSYTNILANGNVKEAAAGSRGRTIAELLK